VNMELHDSPTNEASQRLLSTLGRFQRHVARARDGAPQNTWVDECMNELITAVEIAASEGWRDVIEVLTEMGRVLQTYEEGGTAYLCLPFLADSYESLCLIVGDLYVGRARPAVMQKWRDRYQQALGDVAEAGLTLVQDDEEVLPRPRIVREREGTEEAPAASGEGDAPIGNVDAEEYDNAEFGPFEPPSIDGMAEATTGEDEDRLPRLDDLIPLDEPGGASKSSLTRSTSPASELEAEAPFAPTREDRPSDGEIANTRDDSNGGMPSLAEIRQEAAMETDESSASNQDVEEPSQEKGEDDASEQITAALDALCDDLSRMRQAEKPDESVLNGILDKIALLHQVASDEGRHEAATLCERAAELSRKMWSTGNTSDDAYYDLAYGFCETYFLARDGSGAADIWKWHEECLSLLDSWGESVPENATRAEEETQPQPAPVGKDGEDVAPEKLLEIARTFIANGRAGEAKLLALRAAAQIAMLETHEAEGNVHAAEHSIQESGEAIERARLEVQKAEERVVDAEQRAADSDASVRSAEERVQQAHANIEEIDGRLQQLEAELRRLQEKRDAEAKQLEEARAFLEQKEAEEQKAEKQFSETKEAENQARIELENARQNVNNLQRKRTELDALMDRAREVLTQRRWSLEEIRETIAQLQSGGAHGEPASGDMLF
jgi:hypothetical protein